MHGRQTWLNDIKLPVKLSLYMTTPNIHKNSVVYSVVFCYHHFIRANTESTSATKDYVFDVIKKNNFTPA